jgi:exonuclease V
MKFYLNRRMKPGQNQTPSTSDRQPRTLRRSKRRSEPSLSQSQLTDFFASTSKANTRKSPSPPSIEPELLLLDKKTRRSNSLPSHDDAFSSRMQLILYHHLLSALLSPTFSFSMFCEKVQVDPSAQCSDEFLVHVGLGSERDGNVLLGYPACLDELGDLWRPTVHSLCVRGVSPTLEIVYRKQPKRSASALLEASPSSTSDDITLADQEARDLARAIAASMRE